MTIYSTKVSAHYIARRAAAQAGGTPVDFLSGTFIAGDGNGAAPAISALVAAGHVLHEVWRGDVVVAVTVDEDNAAQVDIRCVIPAAIGGVEVGPFWVREFTISDENGVVCVYGTTQVEKTTSAEGAISDLTIVAAIGESDSSVVILSPPSSNFVTDLDLRTAINAHQATAEEPLYKVDTTSTAGWLSRLFKIRRAVPTQIGVERPATDAEFDAGAPASGASPYPWPTLQQIAGALTGLKEQIAPHADSHVWYLRLSDGAPAANTVYQRDLTFTPAAPGIVIAMSWFVVSHGELPGGIDHGDGSVGCTNEVWINGVPKSHDNTVNGSLEIGVASVPAGVEVTVTSYLHTQDTIDVFPTISQHLAYLFVPLLAV